MRTCGTHLPKSLNSDDCRASVAGSFKVYINPGGRLSQTLPKTGEVLVVRKSDYRGKGAPLLRHFDITALWLRATGVKALEKHHNH
jgi:hypothetical protein